MDAHEDGLLMSGIQHFAFCRRQWALIHIEQQWQENARTAQGQLDHVRCHDETLSEKRDNVFTVRGMRVFSRKLNLSGACDDHRSYRFSPFADSFAEWFGRCSAFRNTILIHSFLRS